MLTSHCSSPFQPSLNRRTAASNAKAVLFAVLVVSATNSATAQTREAQFSDWPEHCSIPGRIIVSNQLTDFSSLERILPRLTNSAPIVGINIGGGDGLNKWTKKLREQEGSSPVQTFEFSVTDLDEKQTAATEAVSKAGCVVLDMTSTNTSMVGLLGKPLRELVERGATLILVNSGGNLAGQYSSRPASVDLADPGFGLLPNTIVHVSGTAGPLVSEIEFEATVSRIPGTLGIMVEQDTAMILSGRKVTAYGSGHTTWIVPESKSTPEHRQRIVQYRSRRQPTSEYLIDFTQWRRLAMERELPPFPPAKPPVPVVENGTLLIVGGGGSPKGLMDRFIELAGGTQNARLVYVPCSEDTQVSSSQSMVNLWKRMGVKHATFIHTKDRQKANSDEEFMAPLKQATGIFFGGGRQWNFADSYYGTRTHQLMKDVLKRNGVIAGSSAGASIQARYLARATPIGNFDIMAPGYERGGLGFLGGVAIDQHFSQRRRQKDMVQLMETHPQLLGIGIDEATAIEVSQSQAKISGKGRVYFYDATLSPEQKSAEHAARLINFVALPAGSVYDLASRNVIVDTTPKTDDANP